MRPALFLYATLALMKATPKPKIIVIVGTTASGKSALAVTLAKKFNGEVISADSRQIYKKLDIGTAKITKKEQKGVKHHLLDIVEIGESYTTMHFKKDATEAIKSIVGRGAVPIIAGGTFFYIDTLLNRVTAPEVPPNEKLRAELEKKDAATLFKELQKKDPNRASVIDAHNKRRLVRALEIVESLGAVPKVQARPSPYDALLLGIVSDKEELREKFKMRANAWLKGGFKKEIKDLLARGVTQKQLQEIGFEYQLGLALVEGTLSDTAFIERFVEKNWQYAKRQLTWLKRDKSIRWVYLSEEQEMHMLVEQFLLN